jgi:hypothetical protein
MKALISIVVIAAICFGGWQFWKYWSELKRKNEGTPPPAEQTAATQQPPGLESRLEASLQKAQQGGAQSLKQWLDTYRRSGMVKDPRLASIELDYVLLLAREDPAEAKRVFAEVKKRIPSNSPVYPRIKALEPTFQ